MNIAPLRWVNSDSCSAWLDRLQIGRHIRKTQSTGVEGTIMKIGTILHPTDFSRNSESAFHMACALARDYGARLVLLHVKPLPTVAYGEFGALPPEATDHLEELKERLARMQPADAGIAVDHF